MCSDCLTLDGRLSNLWLRQSAGRVGNPNEIKYGLSSGNAHPMEGT